MRKNLLVALASACALGAGARAVAAQACVGEPVGDGGWTVAPVLRVRPIDGGGNVDAHDVHFYGGDVAVNVPGRLGIDGGYAYARLMDGLWSQHEYRVRPSLELVRARNASLCLVAGAQLGYRPKTEILLTDSTMTVVGSQWYDEREWRFPVGIGAGYERRVARGSMLTVYTVPQVLFVRSERHLTGPSTGFDYARRHNELGLEIGARVRRGPFFVGASWLHTTWSVPGFDPALPIVWTFTVGFAHGR